MAHAGLRRFVLRIDFIGRYFDMIALALAVTILSAMIVLVGIQVFFRYVLNAPITWSEELATYLFAWMIFTGATVTVRRNEVPALRIVVESMPAGLGSFMGAVADLLCLTISAILLSTGVISCIALIQQKSPAMQIPMTYPSLIMPLAGFGLSLHCLRSVLAAGKATDGR